MARLWYAASVPRTAELVQSYALYLNIFFLLVATAGLVLMAQELVDRGVRTADQPDWPSRQDSTA